jgi:hypothetical protein
MNLVDTDVLIDIQRGHPPAVAWFAGLTELPLVPGFVVMELVQDARNANEVSQVLKLVFPTSCRLAERGRLQPCAGRFCRLSSVTRTGTARCNDRGIRRGSIGDALHLQCEALPRCAQADDR